MQIQQPYLLFLGDVTDTLSGKTAIGIAQWRPEHCLGEYRLSEDTLSLSLPNLSFAQAVEQGAKTLVIGVANAGGVLAPQWVPHLIQALEAGLDIANGLHQGLAEVPEIAETAKRLGRQLFDVRHYHETLPVGKGEPRRGKRLLTVGTDCSVGKMYTSLAIEKAMHAKGMDATFRATGQTGILITGSGISVDGVLADFISGAAEVLSPAANSDDHWDVIEGQGSLFHPSFAGVSLGLLHGAQPDALVMCHEPTRTHMRGRPGRDLPEIQTCIEANLSAAKLTNPDVAVIGVAVNTSALSEEEAREYLAKLSADLGLPCVDPVRNGVDALLERLPA